MPKGAHRGRSPLDGIDSGLPKLTTLHKKLQAQNPPGGPSEVRALIRPALCNLGLRSCAFWCTLVAPFGPSPGEGERRNSCTLERCCAGAVAAWRPRTTGTGASWSGRTWRRSTKRYRRRPTGCRGDRLRPRLRPRARGIVRWPRRRRGGLRPGALLSPDRTYWESPAQEPCREALRGYAEEGGHSVNADWTPSEQPHG